MSLQERIAALSPEKRAIWELRQIRTISGAAPPKDPGRILPRSVRMGRVPLSYPQQRLWLIEQLEPGNAVYNLPLAIRLSGAVHPGVLARAIDEVVRRHEALRTTFDPGSEAPSQVIHPHLSIKLEAVDLTTHAGADLDAGAEKWTMQEAQRPFDLRTGPLLRATLIRLAPHDHVLLVTMHHIVSDGWSLGVLHRELSSIYAAFLDGKRSPLPELPIQYADFALWQRNWLQGPAREQLLRYWRAKLAGMPPLLEFPADRQRPKRQSFRGSHYVCTLPGPLQSALNRLAIDAAATLYMVLLTAFMILLGRYTGRTDIVVGSPIANRGRHELEGLIGFFVNTLIMRVDLSGDPSFRDALARVKETALEAFAHQDLPFEALVEELQPPRDPSYNPLFQVAFAHQNASEVAAGPAGDDRLVEGGTSKFDLTLSVAESSDGISATFEYNTELFEAGTIIAFAQSLHLLLEQATADPGRRISTLPRPEGEQRRRLIATCTGPIVEEHLDVSIPAMCRLQAEARPEAVALEFGGERLSWRALDDRVCAMARTLRAIGAGPGAVIAICLDRSLDLPVAVLAVWRAGAAFVPLDPTAPMSRLRHMLGDTGATIVVTQEHLAGIFREYAGELVLIDGVRAAQAGETRHGEFDPHSDELAYVIYTSGSTGPPKGVAVPHRGLLNVVAAQRAAFALRPEDRILQFSSLTFDAFIFELLLALGSGGTLCLASREATMPGNDLLRTLREQHISVLVIPPSSLAMLPFADLPDLRCLISAGEMLPSNLVSRWSPGRRFFNAYGPTEATIWASLWECTNSSGAPSIGRPILNVQVYILDGDLEPLLAGIPGEIFIGGAGVARGYLGRPDLTSERFLRDPISGRSGAMLYRTGDRGRLLASGEIQFAGRVDNQLKIRGYRIEPGEVEAALMAHPSVQDAVVIARAGSTAPEGGADVRLIAFYTCHSGHSVDAAGLREFARSILPEYMIPLSAQVLETMPLNSSGKADKGSLAALPIVQDAVAPGSASRTSGEETLCAIWAEVLELNHVGADQSFFDLGGHSLLATRALSRINDAFQIELPLRAIFESPSVRELARVVQAAKTGPEDTL